MSSECAPPAASSLHASARPPHAPCRSVSTVSMALPSVLKVKRPAQGAVQRNDTSSMVTPPPATQGASPY